MKDWTQFYTPDKLSDLLIKDIGGSFSPDHILDICAGRCNLLYSAYKRWPKSKYYASDINTISTNFNFNNSISFFTYNALQFNQLRRVFKNKKNKLILANPPFGKLNDYSFTNSICFNQYSNILLGLNRIEFFIIISNLMLLNKGDFFAAILPENVFTSQKATPFKLFLLGCFEDVEIKSHKFKFPESEVKTRMLIGKFKGINKELIHSSEIDTHEIEMMFPVLRGVDNSILQDGYIPKSHFKVVHFNNTNGDVKLMRSISIDNKIIINKLICKNDILIFRVGRNAGSIIYPDKRHFGTIPSDLIFILRNGNTLSKNQVNNLQNILKSKVKGLTSKYIVKKDVYESLSFIIN